MENGTELSGLALDVPQSDFDLPETVEEKALLCHSGGIMNGIPRHSSSQGIIKRFNQKFCDHISRWMLADPKSEFKDDMKYAAKFAKTMSTLRLTLFSKLLHISFSYKKDAFRFLFHVPFLCLIGALV